MESSDRERQATVAGESSPRPKESGTQAPILKKSARRLDIQGLRAVLMIQVLLYHAWTVGSPIGVDSFIMISAFLMTSSFVRRSLAGRMPFFLERWANTFKRLLPPLVVTVLATLGASFLLLDPRRLQEMVTQAFSSVTYWENWRLIHVASDYYAEDHGQASPFQHLWSMSMQGQIFILWPLLMTACVLIARKLKLSVSATTAVAFALISIVSLGWLLLFAPEGAEKYFNTGSRIWEFAFGSMVAAWSAGRIGGAKSPRSAQTRESMWWALGWVALGVLILFCLTPIGSYPGPMALFPLISVSILLLAPAGSSRFSAGNLLALPPLVWLGNISYAVYLVHWPIFIFFLASHDRDRLGLRGGLALMAISVVVAAVMTKLVEQPIQKWQWADKTAIHKAIVVVVSLAVALAGIGVAKVALSAAIRAEKQDLAEYSEDVQRYPGARVMDWLDIWPLDDVPPAEEPIPGPLVPTSWGTFPDECPAPWKSLLTMGDNEGCSRFQVPNAQATVMVAGNSHVQQNVIPPLLSLIKEHQFNGISVVKGGCSWGDPAAYDDDEACATRNQEILDYVDELHPDYAFLMVTSTMLDEPGEYVVPGAEELVRELTARGITVFGMRDNPRSWEDLYACSADEWDPSSPFGGCMLPRKNYLAAENPALFLENIEGFHMIDVTSGYCTDTVCPTIVGNIHVYYDQNHLSYEFSESLSDMFAAQVEPYL